MTGPVVVCVAMGMEAGPAFEDSRSGAATASWMGSWVVDLAGAQQGTAQWGLDQEAQAGTPPHPGQEDRRKDQAACCQPRGLTLGQTDQYNQGEVGTVIGDRRSQLTSQAEGQREDGDHGNPVASQEGGQVAIQRRIQAPKKASEEGGPAPNGRLCCVLPLLPPQQRRLCRRW